MNAGEAQSGYFIVMEETSAPGKHPGPMSPDVGGGMLSPLGLFDLQRKPIHIKDIIERQDTRKVHYT